jgi:thioredoxin 1
MSPTGKSNSLNDTSFKAEVLQSTGLIMVYFWADWCGPCHIMAPVIEDLAETFRGKVKVYRLDIDHNARIPHEYGIQVLPTLLFFERGELVDQVLGAISRSVLAEKVNHLLHDHGV